MRSLLYLRENAFSISSSTGTPQRRQVGQFELQNPGKTPNVTCVGSRSRNGFAENENREAAPNCNGIEPDFLGLVRTSALNFSTVGSGCTRKKRITPGAEQRKD
jgi:hypothetical protein